MSHDADDGLMVKIDLRASAIGNGGRLDASIK
jgi:hypothetical protein